MAQVSAASVGHLPYLVPHSPAIADMAGRALTKTHRNCVSTSRGGPEATPLLPKNGFGFASPFFSLPSPSLFYPYSLTGTACGSPSKRAEALCRFCTQTSLTTSSRPTSWNHSRMNIGWCTWRRLYWERWSPGSSTQLWASFTLRKPSVKTLSQ